MSQVSVSPMQLDPTRATQAPPEQRRAMLRQAVDEMVGVTFFGQMLKTARGSSLKGEFGHGGRGEDVFGAQLDQELARRAGQGMSNRLSDAIYERLVKRV